MPFQDKTLRKEEAEIKGSMGGTGEADLSKSKVVLKITSQRKLKREPESLKREHLSDPPFLPKTTGKLFTSKGAVDKEQLHPTQHYHTNECKGQNNIPTENKSKLGRCPQQMKTNPISLNKLSKW